MAILAFALNIVEHLEHDTFWLSQAVTRIWQIFVHEGSDNDNGFTARPVELWDCLTAAVAIPDGSYCKHKNNLTRDLCGPQGS